jgi:uncharacterized protein YkwD
MKTAPFAAVAALTLLLAGCASALPPDVTTRSRPDVIAALNAVRTQGGLQAVGHDSRLDQVARTRAPKAWLSRDNLKAAHSGFGRSIDASGFPGAWTGEAYWAGPSSDSPNEIIAYLMKSPPHRAILMSQRANVCAAASSANKRDMTVAIACGRL